MIVRSANAVDASGIATVYGHHVLHGLGTFEERPPAPGEIAARVAAAAALGLPYLVAEREGRIAGFAYASAFRPRPGYRHTAEDSVYVGPDQTGRGVGKALLGRLIGECEALGLRQLVAVIGDSGNTASIGLHRALGFEEVGVFRSIGFKFGRWVDVVFMQRALNSGDESAPTAAGLALDPR
ncbi:MAG: N-acetyltransferase family protein [Caulobacteraceae bacterium]